MKLYTIGFTQKSAEEFFALLKHNGVECVVDVRVHPGGQLAGFAKQGDLAYFLKALNGCDYRHMPELAPTEDMMKAYRRDKDIRAWEQAFTALMDERGIPARLDRAFFERQTCCLLCSEPSPAHCHRRLVADRMKTAWPGVEVVHLQWFPRRTAPRCDAPSRRSAPSILSTTLSTTKSNAPRQPRGALRIHPLRSSRYGSDSAIRTSLSTGMLSSIEKKT